MLWAFEPVKYCIAAPRLSARDDPQVRLKTTEQKHARLRLTPREDPLHQAVVRERLHDPRRGAGRDDVEVTAGLAAAAEAADGVQGRAAALLSKRGHQRRRRVVRFSE